ncbi:MULTISPECIES: hypothetical protein [unclassified Streptomyces]|uniref:hypothetical protein n=1 Tax=unclassified Streptomyces TaxID=2593676 RepID=UPI003416371B
MSDRMSDLGAPEADLSDPSAPSDQSDLSDPSGWGRWTALALLPGAVGSLTLLGLDHSSGQWRLAIGLAGALALVGTLRACLRRGPWPVFPALLVAPAFAVLPAVWCAHLLSVHARRGPAPVGRILARPLPLALVALFAAACALEVLSCASVLAGRLPGCDVLAVPVRAVAETWGAAAVPALARAAAALGLLAHATVALSRAPAHLSLSTTS